MSHHCTHEPYQDHIPSDLLTFPDMYRQDFEKTKKSIHIYIILFTYRIFFFIFLAPQCTSQSACCRWYCLSKRDVLQPEPVKVEVPAPVEAAPAVTAPWWQSLQSLAEPTPPPTPAPTPAPVEVKPVVTATKSAPAPVTPAPVKVRLSMPFWLCISLCGNSIQTMRDFDCRSAHLSTLHCLFHR